MNRQKRWFGIGGIACLAGALAVSAQTQPVKGYTPVNMVSDIAGVAHRTDPLLVNAWGIAVSPAGRIWVADNGTGVSTVYKPNGTPLSLIVTIPPAAGGTNGTPTGVVFNETTNFVVSFNSTSGPSVFLFATEDGTISGWNSDVDPSNAIVMVDNSGSNAVYKGIALGESDGSNYLYVANFNAGVVEMYDSSFGFVGSFTDPDPELQTNDFAPFGIQNIGGKLYVTFAKRNPGTADDLAGPGNGYVDVFKTDGTLKERLASQGTLNSPWGLALAPANFGRFAGALLVGNFGDGRISGFDPKTGTFLGQLKYREGEPISINGLWGLTFAPSKPPADSDEESLAAAAEAKKPVLYFTAGLVDETAGLFGFIRRALPTDFK